MRASELQEKVVQRIYEMRNPDALPTYRKELAKYKRRLGKRREGTYELSDGFLGKRKVRGFRVEHLGQGVFVQRPEKPRSMAYAYSGYERAFGTTLHAGVVGLLADAAFNRDLRPQRVDEYTEAMRTGQWHDLLSDPITITADGQVVNGQHRLAAASRVDWSCANGSDPAFLVVWGVSPKEALHADGSRRTPRDEKTIAGKLLRDE